MPLFSINTTHCPALSVLTMQDDIMTSKRKRNTRHDSQRQLNRWKLESHGKSRTRGTCVQEELFVKSSGDCQTRTNYRRYWVVRNGSVTGGREESGAWERGYRQNNPPLSPLQLNAPTTKPLPPCHISASHCRLFIFVVTSRLFIDWCIDAVTNPRRYGGQYFHICDTRSPTQQPSFISC